MTVRRYEIIFCRPENQRLTLERLAERAGFHPAVVQAFIDCGLIEPSAREGTRLLFDKDVVPRLRMIGRLRENLGINLAGIAVILHLRDRLSALQRENAVYRGHVGCCDSSTGKHATKHFHETQHQVMPTVPPAAWRWC